MLLCFCSSPLFPFCKRKVLFREEYKLVLVHIQDNYSFFTLYLKLAQSADISYVWWGRGLEFQSLHDDLPMPGVAGCCLMN